MHILGEIGHSHFFLVRYPYLAGSRAQRKSASFQKSAAGIRFRHGVLQIWVTGLVVFGTQFILSQSIVIC